MCASPGRHQLGVPIPVRCVNLPGYPYPPAIKQNALEWQVQVGVDTKTDRSFGNRSMSDHKVRRLGHYHLLYEVGVVLNERWVGADAGDFIRGGRV